MNIDDQSIANNALEQAGKGWPPHAKKFLDELYASFGSTKDEQKYNVLLLSLGINESSISFSHNPTVAQKCAMLEYEILSNNGLIQLVLA